MREHGQSGARHLRLLRGVPCGVGSGHRRWFRQHVVAGLLQCADADVGPNWELRFEVQFLFPR